MTAPLRRAGIASAVRRTFVSVCAAALCGVPAATAQSRPYPALFGGAANDATASQLFDVMFSVDEGYDTNVLARDTAGSGPGVGLDGLFTSLTADLRYAAQGRRAQMALNTGTNWRYFQEFGELAALGHYLGVGASVSLGPRTTLTANEAVSYTPPYLLNLFPSAVSPVLGNVIPPAPGYAALTDLRTFNSATDVMLIRRVGRRATLEFNSAYRWITMSGVSARSDLTTYEAGAHWRQPINRDLALRLGYTHRAAQYSSGRNPLTHDIGIGAEYDRPLGRDRRTKLRFSMGTSMIEAPPPQRPEAVSVKQFHAVGDVLLTHQIRRTWSARVGYRRGAQFVEELSAPVFNDGIRVSADGFVNRRTDVNATVAYSSGKTYSTGATFDTYTATARARIAANRGFAGFIEYVYYFYRFDGGLQLVTGAPPELSRNSVKVGLSFWLPLLRKN